jgi:hypothetical protein
MDSDILTEFILHVIIELHGKMLKFLKLKLPTSNDFTLFDDVDSIY